ncbi:diguanylate cyclase domain-containing protein [Aquicoccus sp. G2-2]|uniref:diguanylate cyclase domain-containing protein n=1 Tax=Aquicoccus sp. G2-2 TaxID=3092120 RepID=UPI002ADF9A47|nr:diguanylate cyclase [Aquicoccus sp. G2-2]MEA1113777.1 diguanylate cyclase [Aquicoccus sp. G2-2]
MTGGQGVTEGLAPMLDVLCPAHVMIDATGHLRHVGPTLRKIRPGKALIGLRFLELCELRRPRAITTTEALMACAGIKLHLKFRDAPETGLKGVLMPLPGGAGAVINLAFGISVLDAVRDYDLTAADFAATDLAVEMLYLVEAKTAAMDVSRQLNAQLQTAMIAADERAFTDTLTGLKNRRAMEHVLGRLIALRRPFALMHVDLDYFKQVNDTLGHAAGDHVLQQVARVMVAQTRAADTVARVGGDEFVLLLDGLVEQKGLKKLAHRIIADLEHPIPFGGQLCHVSASAGTVLSGSYDEVTAAQMLADADLALYASKHKGRACHTFFSPALRESRGAAAKRLPGAGRGGG